MKNGFTVVEVAFVLILIFAVAFFTIPLSLDDTRQAKFIQAWRETYSNVEYMFTVIGAQNGEKLYQAFKKTSDENEKSKMMLDLLKSYLRVTSPVNPVDYKTYYFDKSRVQASELYYFDYLYSTSDKKIIGFKWLSNDDYERPLSVMLFDVNGIEPPNTWGKDIYGIDIFKNRIEPLGRNCDMVILKNNCSKEGKGTYCSYYYLYGGEFD